MMLALRDQSIDMLCDVIVLPHMLGIPDFGVAQRVVGAGRGSQEVRWAHQDSNLGPSDYESDALTN
jgi:hypothetical protein